MELVLFFLSEISSENLINYKHPFTLVELSLKFKIIDTTSV